MLEGLEKAKAITEEEYRALVETASGAYGTMKNATAGEVKDFKKEMQNHWAELQRSKAVKKLVTPMTASPKKKTVEKKATKKKVAKKTA